MCGREITKVSTSWYNQSQMTKASEDQAHKAVRGEEKVEKADGDVEKATAVGEKTEAVDEKMVTAA